MLTSFIDQQRPQCPRNSHQIALGARDYLAKALRDYQSGLRKNPVMAGFVDKLSNQDIENLAAYYASQPAAVVIKQ